MADVIAVRNEYRMQTWAALIQECSTSGLTNKEFCRQRGISEKSYYYWLRKLRDQAVAQTQPELIPLNDSVTGHYSERLHIQYRGAELNVPADVDIEAVAALLHSIQKL